MWVVVNNQDQTGNIEFRNFDLDLALSDPMPTLSFELVDVNSSIALDFNQNVMVWDENAAPVGGIRTIPAINLIADSSFQYGALCFNVGGFYSGNVTIANNTATLTFNNQASTGAANDAHFTQAKKNITFGYCTPGQKYMFSAYVQGINTPTNIVYYLQINWLDGNKNLISSTASTAVSPPLITSQETISGVAPAGAAYATIQCGGYATNTTNSGGITFDTLLLEPMWFPGKAMGNNTPVSYPSPDCNWYQNNSFNLPDLTCARINRLFFGYIAVLEASYEGKKRTYKVQCRAMSDQIENGGTNTPINVAYTGQTDTYIINDLVNTYFSGIFSTGQPNITQPLTTLVTGRVIDAIVFSDITFREALNNISDITGFSYHFDPYMYVRYHPIPYDYSTFSLLSDPNSQPNNTTTFAPQEYTYIKDGTQTRNSVKVLGGEVQVTVQELFNGNGSTKVFTLTNTPININTISFNAGSTTFAPTNTNKIGVQGQDVNGQSGIVALMETSSKKVTFNTAPPSGTNNVVITYTQNRPVSILVEENSSIGQYGRRFVTKITDTNLASNDAARARGESELAQWAFPVQNITFKLSSEMGADRQPMNMFLAPGTTIPFTSVYDNLTNEPFVVQTVKVTSEGGGVNIYDYEAGVYRPTLQDIHRNVQKAVARSKDSSGNTPIQETYEIIREQMSYAESVTPTTLSSSGAFIWNTDRYGYSSFS